VAELAERIAREEKLGGVRTPHLEGGKSGNAKGIRKENSTRRRKESLISVRGRSPSRRPKQADTARQKEEERGLTDHLCQEEQRRV